MQNLKVACFVRNDDGSLEYVGDNLGQIPSRSELAAMQTALSKVQEQTEEDAKWHNSFARWRDCWSIEQRLRRNDRQGYVYLLYSHKEQEYKIGVSHSVCKRLNSVRCNQKDPSIESVYFFYCDRARTAEAAFHRFFDRKHTHGEWFNLDADDIAFIKTVGGNQ